MSVGYQRWLPVRVAVYMLVCALMLLAVVHGVQAYGPRRILRENGVLECIQISLLAITAGMLFLRARRAGGPGRAFWLLLATLALVGCMREMDVVLEDLGSRFLRKRVPYILCALALSYCIARRQAVIDEIRSFMTRPVATLMVIGAMVVLWGEFLGHRQLWKSFGRWYDSGMAKRLVEEGLEACGYVLILAGCVEENILDWWKR